MANDSNLKPFPPGVSGNPAGRPKGPISQILRELGESSELTFSITKTDKEGKQTTATATLSTGEKQSINEAIAAKLLQMAMNGDMKAIREVLNRTEGRPHQSITLNKGADEGADLNGVTAENFDLFEQWMKDRQPDSDPQ